MKKRKRKAIALVTVKRNGLELSLFPWENPDTVFAGIEAFLAETDARPWLTDEDTVELSTPEMGRVWSG